MENSLENGMSQEPTKTGYEGLTPKNKDRHDAFATLCDAEQALEIVGYLEPTGGNCFKSVFDKMDIIKSEEDRVLQGYAESIAESFDINETYTIDDIVYSVAQSRRKHKLQTISTKVKANSLNELSNIFIIKKKYHDDDVDLPTVKKRIVGYTPVFDLTDMKG